MKTMTGYRKQVIHKSLFMVYNGIIREANDGFLMMGFDITTKVVCNHLHILKGGIFKNGKTDYSPNWYDNLQS